MKLSSVCVAALVCLSGTAQAQIVNIDATNGAGNSVSISDAACPFTGCFFVGNQLTLDAGTYTVTPINVLSGGLYTAASRFVPTENKWEWSLWMKIGADPLSAKIGFGGGHPNTNPPDYQPSAALAFSSAPAPFTFTVLSAATPVKFLWVDDQFTDNVANSGISINVAVVPEPGTYALMLAGLAAVGFLAKRRRQPA